MNLKVFFSARCKKRQSINDLTAQLPFAPQESRDSHWPQKAGVNGLQDWNKNTCLANLINCMHRGPPCRKTNGQDADKTSKHVPYVVVPIFELTSRV